MLREFWTTITPRKLYWEANQLYAGLPWEQWYQQPTFLEKSMRLLAGHGFTGIRLNIFNFELTSDGNHYDWQPIDTALSAAQAAGLKVDLCLGPFAYPLWPGLRVPKKLLSGSNPLEETFAKQFITAQLQRYGHDERISAFYLSNEWPNQQQLEGREAVWGATSQELMLQLTAICVQYTAKPIIMNTSLDASQAQAITQTYRPVWELLPNQFQLALDVYPSRERLRLAPRLWWQRHTRGFASAVTRLQQQLPVPVIFGELEAQPWGRGQSWLEYLSAPTDSFTPQTLLRTYRRYVAPTGITKVTWWGSEFWLIANLTGAYWPLKVLKQLSRGKK